MEAYRRNSNDTGQNFQAAAANSTSDYSDEEQPLTPYYGGNGMTSYPHPTIMVNNMVQQMMQIAEKNRQLKEAIRVNNQGFQTKLNELQQWKAKWRAETTKIRQNYNKAHDKITKLTREKILLESKNLRLKQRLSSISLSGLDNGPDSSIAPVAPENESLNLMETLEEQLKLAMEEKQTLTVQLNQLKTANQKLQENVRESNEMYGKLERNNVKISESYHNLLRERDHFGKHIQDLETANKETKAQLLSVLEENKVYEAENTRLNQQKQKHEQIIMEFQDDRNKYITTQDTLQKLRKDSKLAQSRFEREMSELKKAMDEKSQSFEQLFTEYEQVRQDCECVTAAHATCREKDYDKMYACFLSAEESLKKKDEEIRYVKRQSEGVGKKMEEDIAFFKAQADVYKQDFLCEREDRSKLHEQNQKFQNLIYEKDRDIDQLKKKLEQLQFDQMRR